MQEEALENKPTDPETPSVPKKRGRKPKTSENKAPNQTDTQETPKRKRGRPPKNKALSDGSASAPANEEAIEKNPESSPSNNASSGSDESKEADNTPKRGRPRKIFKREGGPEWRDIPEDSAPSETSADAEYPEEIFQHTDSDDFAYAEAAETPQIEETRTRENSAEEDSEEIPTSFSTTDEDLAPEAYATRYEAEDNANDYREASDEPKPQQQDSLPQRQQKVFDKRGRWQQNQQNNQRQQNFAQSGRDRNNFRNAQQSRNMRGQQGGQRQQNAPQKLQQRGQQNQRQQQAQQLQKQKKPRWMQSQNAENDLMNPADLPEWSALKTEKALDEFLAQAFFGIKPAEQNAEEAKAPFDSAPDADLAQKDFSGEACKEDLAPKGSEGNTEDKSPEDTSSKSGDSLASEEPQSNEGEGNYKIEPSYWAVMNSANKILAPEAKEQIVAAASLEPEHAAHAPDFQSSKSESGYKEPDAMELTCGKAIESISGFDEFYSCGLRQMQEKLDGLGAEYRRGSGKSELVKAFFRFAASKLKLVRVNGVLDVFGDGFGGAITFASDSYKLSKSAVYVPQMFIDKYSLRRGHILGALAMPPREGGRETCPIAVMISSVMGGAPESAKDVVPFTELTPYYPTRRMIMEADASCGWDNLSMRAIDLLAPIGLGQRALIVAPPRTGKTVLMQGMAKSIRRNTPEAHLIVLLVDERPEEVTDFRRSVDAEVVASTFDEDASSHVHAAEMVISKARRMVEKGRDVVILLDSITRLARAYNAMMPNGGRTMSGGVEANALQKPKKFFGSARNIEGGGSLTIIGTALIETGSKMDEVIFEEFKGTGNLELHLDRALSDKRIFPSINMEKSGTRKEELLYHPDEMSKIYALRRAMKGIPAADAMEMLVQRLKKVKTNIEFLLGLNR